ncbi:MAG: hypothetical protein JKX85_07495, partial [Phycisphaeraceae bacterium]|nr:hypothetical protein [Phycisphaeraceae bacterium]
MNLNFHILARPIAVLSVSLLAMMASTPKVARADDVKPAFYLPFDNTLKSNDGQEPSQERGIKYVPGVLGQAAYIGGNGQHNYNKSPLLEYDAKDLFAGDSGTVMFWASPNWDGKYDDIKKMPWYTFLSTMGGDTSGASGG